MRLLSHTNFTNEGITDDITETFRKHVIKRYASGSVGFEGGIVWS